MTERIAQVSPALGARIAGGLWLIVIAASAVAFIPLSTLIARHDAAATVHSILANESLYRLSIAAELVASLCYVGVTVLLYELLKPVSRSLSFLAAFFSLGGVAIGGLSLLSRLAPLILLQGGESSGAFTAGPLQSLVLTSLDLHRFSIHISLVFFGLHCCIAGYLLLRSAFLPWILGVLLAIAGSSYLIHSFASLLAPSFGVAFGPIVMPAALAGEGSLSLWLVIKGVDVPRWREQAASPAGRFI